MGFFATANEFFLQLDEQEVDEDALLRQEELAKVQGAQFTFRNRNIKTLSLRDIYNEFFGLEEFEHKPMDGGFHAVDAKYKPREWRDTTKHGWKQSDQNFFSRVKRVCEALRAAGGGAEGYPLAIGMEYNEVMKNKGLLGVVEKMQESGVLTLGAARGPKRARTA